MTRKITYPKPSEDVVNEFMERFSCGFWKGTHEFVDDISDHVRLYISKVLIVFQDESGDVKVIMPYRVTTGRFLCTSYVDFDKLKGAFSVKVLNRYFSAKRLYEVLDFIYKFINDPVDIYLIDDAEKLGIGTKCGFFVVSASDINVSPIVELPQILKYDKPIKITTAYLSKIDINVPDRIIEKWVRELGLDF